MLVKAVIGRMHDLIALFMLHQHADDRRLRQDGMDAACDALVARRLADVPGEAGAVVIMDGDDTLLDLAAAFGRAVNGEVAALGVPADTDGLVAVLPRDARDVFDRLLLRGDLLQKAHVEVFLPPDDRIVRAAERDIDAAVAKVDRQRRKLLLDGIVKQRCVAVQRHIAKARARHQLAQHFRDRVRHEDTHGDVLPAMAGEKRLRRLIQRQAAPELGRRHDAVKVDKAQLCQNQRVHLVERRNFERQIPAPVQIIHQICHIVNLRQWVSFSFIVWRA